MVWLYWHFPEKQDSCTSVLLQFQLSNRFVLSKKRRITGFSGHEKSTPDCINRECRYGGQKKTAYKLHTYGWGKFPYSDKNGSITKFIPFFNKIKY